jgi:hypothetical protein
MLICFTAMAKTSKNPPWWLEEGTESCPACSHAYVYQTECRCVACDGAVCMECVQTISLETFCPDCVVSTVEV